ncbi:GyrI-like domain-containing protein [Paraglaciecola sp. MB-3u-78]|uniref:GyrI-like domain-containing protein n=1 Tax=Paraglaciecola sp. MB-3u-78 TaxID=2058332 RepID=UPI000C336BF6|nr:GyrI-like domain-containing protein [Paraglaciecola sp. MB-3u-78]PKG99329.1 transcriptional regulator [Paraglaciecola sp. MB-3u-78]
MMSIKCELAELVPQPSLSIRVITSAQDLPDVFAKGLSEIMQYLQEFKQQNAGHPYATYYNFDARNLDVEFGIPILRRFSGRDNIQASQTPGGKAITCLHVGPYSEIEPYYRALVEWIKDNGYKASGIAYEVYLNDPKSTQSEKLQTQIYEMISTSS